MRRFENKVVLVTGAARGIGKNIAAAFAREGARVVLTDKDKSRGRTTAVQFQQQNLKVDFVYADLSKTGAASSLVRQVYKRYKGLDVLVNNARSGKRVGLLEETEKSWDEGMSVTLKAAFFASQEAVRVMAKKGGSIVNMSSVAAHATCLESPVYHIAKAGLMQMTRYLASFGGPYQVRVNAILPGFIIKDEHKGKYEAKNNLRYRKVVEFCHPLGHPGDADDVARSVLFLCSPEAAFLTGQALTVDGGLVVQEPSDLVLRFAKKNKLIT